MLARTDRGLSDDYIELDSITSTGTQCINTGYYWTTETTKLVADIKLNSNTANQSMWGNEEYYNSGSGRYFAGIPHGKNGSFSYYIGTGGAGNFSITVGTRTLIEVTTTPLKWTLKKNGTNVITNASYSTTMLTYANAYTKTNNTGRIWIFSNHNSGQNGQTSGPTQNIGGMTVYQFQLWDNGVIVRNMIPAKRKSDNAIGMVDSLTQTFYPNAGTGTFTAGKEIPKGFLATTTTDNNTTKYFRARVDRTGSNYIPVEYIKNSGTQIIDTGYVPSYTGNFKVELDFSISTVGYRYLLLSTYNQGNALSLEIKTNNYLRLYMNNGNLDTTLDIAITANVKHKAIFEFNYSTKTYKITLDNNSRSASYTTATTEPTYSMYMFVDRALRYSTFPKAMSVYNCKLYNGTTLVKDLIPAKRFSDNKPGMYDAVNDTFIVNTGTGEFSYGKSIA